MKPLFLSFVILLFVSCGSSTSGGGGRDGEDDGDDESADRDDGATQIDISASGSLQNPAWSPAGDLIVYQCLAGGQWDLWVMATDGTGKRQVTTDSAYDGAPSWSPDGSQIAFESTPDEPDGSSGSTLWFIDVP